IPDLADDRPAAHDALAPVLLHERARDRAPEAPFERLAEARRALDAADVGRHDDEVLVAEAAREVVGEEGVRLDVLARAAEGVLEGGDAVDLERDDPVRVDRLEEPGDVARHDRVAGLGLLLLARI